MTAKELVQTQLDEIFRTVRVWTKPSDGLQVLQEQVKALVRLVREEQMRRDCKVVCCRCFEGDLAFMSPSGSGHWVHPGGTVCRADSLRRAFAKQEKKR